MTATINASTTAGVVITPDNSGNIQLQYNGVAAPAFSAYISGYQGSVAQSTWTKISLSAENFDTNNNFDSTTNYRFTPTVAGYYQVNGFASFGTIGATNPNNGLVAIYKNGGSVSSSQYSSGTNASFNLSTSILVYMNGSSDYVELYGYMTGSGANQGAFNGGSTGTTLTGCLVRSA
jgi:hypothetical protein